MLDEALSVKISALNGLAPNVYVSDNDVKERAPLVAPGLTNLPLGKKLKIIGLDVCFLRKNGERLTGRIKWGLEKDIRPVRVAQINLVWPDKTTTQGISIPKTSLEST